MQDMTPDEVRRFLTEAVRTGKLATVRADGRPHVVPIWYVMDGEDLIFTTWHTSVKAKNMRRDPRVAMSIDDEEPPFSFVMIEGEAQLIELPPEELVPWTTRIGARYMGEELGEQFGKRNGVEGELLVRLKPAKIVARKNLAE